MAPPFKQPSITHFQGFLCEISQYGNITLGKCWIWFLVLSDRVPSVAQFSLFRYFARYKARIILKYCCVSIKSPYTNFAEAKTDSEECC